MFSCRLSMVSGGPTKRAILRKDSKGKVYKMQNEKSKINQEICASKIRSLSRDKCRSYSLDRIYKRAANKVTGSTLYLKHDHVN